MYFYRQQIELFATVGFDVEQYNAICQIVVPESTVLIGLLNANHTADTEYTDKRKEWFDRNNPKK